MSRRCYAGTAVNLFSLLVLYSITISATELQYANHWAVELSDGLTHEEVNNIAVAHGFINHGKVIGNVYKFEHRQVSKRSVDKAVHHTNRLTEHPKVMSVEQQEIKIRVKRASLNNVHTPEPHITLSDAKWPSMWYLMRGENSKKKYDMNVIPAWQLGYTGKNVKVTILDDGIEREHPDLKRNYDGESSYDVNSDDDDPNPRYDYTNENRHGTRCAGEVAAVANNTVCSVGVAYDAKIGGIRMLDGDVTDLVEAKSLSHNPNHIDIYSSSWGPDDNGRTVDGPGTQAKLAFEQGVNTGRNGKGNIFVWASGNGGSHTDSCACDGYTNSIYTLSVSSASESNDAPWYLEQCASTIATTYSSGANFGQQQIITTDLRGQCTERHTGTSASAPLAAGLLAVMLEANPDLTWRDVQYVTLMSANPDPLSGDGEFKTNGVGRQYSHKFGYGLMDCYQMVVNAKKWTKTAPPQLRKTMDKVYVQRALPFEADIQVPGCEADDVGCIRFLEHVQLSLKMSSSRRGMLSVVLTSPSGTDSTILPERRADSASAGFDDWPFMSVHFWGENPAGTWKFKISNGRENGRVISYQLIMYGVAVNATDMSRQGDGGVIKCNQACSASSGCYGPGADQCRKCADGYKQVEQSSNCTQSCPDGYFDQGPICKMCDLTCATCDSPSKCITCPDKMLLGPHHLCVEHCPDGYFADDKSSCIPCAAECTSCTSLEDCLKCSPHHDVVNGRCENPCKPGEYRDSQGDCTPCDDSKCELCTGPDSCARCSSPLKLYNNNCVNTCPDSTFEQLMDREGASECHSCHESCATCYQEMDNNCLSCHPADDLTSDKRCKSRRKCLPGQYLSPQAECLPCDTSFCKTCHGPHSLDCTSCSEGLSLKDGSCVKDCGSGFYSYTDDSDGHTSCQPCHHMCFNCTGPQDTDCLACSIGNLTVVNGKSHCTYDCHAKFSVCNCSHNCLTCTGPRSSDCLSCVDGFILNQAGACVDNCDDGYFIKKLSDGSSMCHSCNAECLTCSGAASNECLSCVEGMVLYEGSCVDIPECHDNQYFDTDKRRCDKCHTSCHTCDGPTEHNCLSCDLSTNKQLHAKTKQCLPCCLDGKARSNLCCACNKDQILCDVAFDKVHLPTNSNGKPLNYTHYIGLSVASVLAVLIIWLGVFLVLQYRSYGTCVFNMCGNNNLLVDSSGANMVRYSTLADKDEDIMFSSPAFRTTHIPGNGAERRLTGGKHGYASHSDSEFD